MADTSEGATRDVGVAKSTILRLIRPSAPASNPETAALRAECEGLRLAFECLGPFVLSPALQPFATDGSPRREPLPSRRKA
jgi:hypothetical protein